MVGISRPYSGPLKEVAAGYVETLKALFDNVNTAGGIAGARVELLERDDQAIPAQTEKQVKALADDGRVLALIGVIGTGNVQAAYQNLDLGKLPLVGPFTGSTALRTSGHRMLFHVRASYDDELNAIAESMAERGPISKVLVLYQDDAFGVGVWEVFTKMVASKGLRLSLSGLKFERSLGNFADANATKAAIQQADAVLLVATSNTASVILKNVRVENKRASLYGLSVMDVLAVVKDVGAGVAHGLILPQVVPNPRKSSLKLVRDYRTLVTAAKLPLSYTGLEGYLAGRVLLEAFARIKGTPSREKVQTALEDLGQVDLGGFPIRFSRKSHEGSSFVDLTMVSASGTVID